MEEGLTMNGFEMLEALRKARDLKGADYVYVDPDGVRAGPHEVDEDGAVCVYGWQDDDGEWVPGCIVGHVLPVELLPSIADLDADAVVVARDFDPLGWDYNAGEIAWAAQLVQDDGATWGEAVEAAERRARELGVIA